MLTAAECEGANMDYDSMAQRKTMLGSGGVIIMDEDTCMVKAALRIMRFYAHESCGWCIPCREGTTWPSQDPAANSATMVTEREAIST